jgi:lactate permease
MFGTMPWEQHYAPLGGLAVSALVAAIPVAVLMALLAFGRVRAPWAATGGLFAALCVAIGVYHMPIGLAVSSAVFGGAFGLFPIGWILVNAMFIHQLSVSTGQFDALQRQISGISADRRIQALLVAYCFGAFVEGAAGFGAPVAISAALLIGLGFAPLQAAALSLIGNTAPVAFGSLGTPLLTLSKTTGLDLEALSAMVGRQLPFFSLLVPFWLVCAQAGWRGMLEVWPACLAAGTVFGATQFAVSNLHGPWLVDIASSMASMAALVVLTRFWRPAGADKPGGANAKEGRPAGIDWPAWLPWASLTVFVFVWGLPAVKSRLNRCFAPEAPFPGLHLMVMRMPPVAVRPEPEAARFVFNALSATGTALLLAGIVAGLGLGVGPRGLVRLYLRNLWRLRESMLTIVLMLALGFTTRYSGSDSTLGLAFAATGGLFAFFSPLIGWLGVALTGSDTSSNVLFGNLQVVTARQLGLSPILTAASNSSGGVMGKMIDAQSIVVASVATGGSADSPKPGAVLRAVFMHSVALAVLVGALVAFQAATQSFWVPVVVK